MNKPYITDVDFNRDNFASITLPAEFDGCTFAAIDCSGMDFSDSWFTDCTFTNCNLSLVPLRKTAFKKVQFTGCKMLGLHFEDCDPFLFDISLDGCNAGQCSFYKIKIALAVFKDTDFTEADFTGADATATSWAGCNLDKAAFENAVLQKADLSAAYQFAIDPALTNIAKAVFCLHGLPGLLHQYHLTIIP